MKTKILLLSLFILGIVSCQKDTNDLYEKSTTHNILIERTSSEVENFRQAINKMNQPKYLPTKEYTEKYGNELSNERKQILLEPAKKLIYSTGVNEQELQRETNDDINIILNKVFKIYISKTSKKQ